MHKVNSNTAQITFQGIFNPRRDATRTRVKKNRKRNLIKKPCFYLFQTDFNPFFGILKQNVILIH